MGGSPVVTGDTQEIRRLGTVRFYVDASNLTIRNGTLPDHALHPGRFGGQSFRLEIEYTYKLEERVQGLLVLLMSFSQPDS